MIFEKIRKRIFEAAEGGIGEACREIEKIAASLCPVESGELKNSIRTETGGLSGKVSAGSDHGVYVELGTVHRAAQPFLYPAFSAVKTDVSRRIAEKI